MGWCPLTIYVVMMKPDPNPPSFYFYDETELEAAPDNGDDDVDSKSPPSFNSSPRRFSPEEDGMDIGGGSDEEKSTNNSRQGSKRTRHQREESDEQADLLSSTEPVKKKRRTQEPAAQANNTAVSSTSVSLSSEAREYQNLQQLVNWTCEHVLDMNQGLAYKIGDIFSPNTFAQFRNALEQAIQANAPELVEKILATGMYHCVPEALENALAIANSVGAKDVIAVLNQHRNALSSSSISSNSFPSATSASTSSSSTTTASTSANSLSTSVAPLSGLEAGWQKKVCLDLNYVEIKEILKNLTNPEFGPRLNMLLFGEDNPLNGKYEIREVTKAKKNMMQLLIVCGAVCLHNHRKIVMLSSDFDRDKFLAGLLSIQKEERVAAENLAEGIPNRLFSALMFAALWGDLEIVRTLLDNGAIPIAVDKSNKNALMFAAKFGHFGIVRLLLQYDINVNAVTGNDDDDDDGKTALFFASNYGHYAVCQLLLQNGARLDIVSRSMPLHIAAENGNAELCTLFILHRANINQADSDDETPLYRAVKKEQIPICKLLVKSGANINFGNSEGTILLMAISTTNEELVEYLLSQGAEVDGIPPSDHDRMPLAYAARNNHSGMVKLLLDRGAPIDRTDKKNRTALWDACNRDSLSAAKLLLERGANPNVVDKGGTSIIETATCSGNVEIVKLLIQHNVTLFSQRNEGFLALKIAIENGFVSIAQILLAANVPAEMILDKQAPSLLILAMQNLSGKTLLDMLALLLKHYISLRRTDDMGNDALMLAAKDYDHDHDSLTILLQNRAPIGQINKNGQNALAIVIDVFDFSEQTDELKMILAVGKLVNLLISAQLQPNWLALRKDALNRAKDLLTREIILVSWAWPLVGTKLPIDGLAKKNINLGALHGFIQFVINCPNAVASEKIDHMLGMAGLCPPLIHLIRPYIAALSQIKSLLFGHSATDHDNIIQSFIAGVTAALERIPLQPGEQWKPYTGALSNSQVGIALNQIANAELDSLIAMSAATESGNLSSVFTKLFETCFNLSFTDAFLPAAFPAYTVATGTVTDNLMVKGVYSALAKKIEAAWKSTWVMFEGKEMSIEPSTTISYSSTSSIVLSSYLDDPTGIFSDGDFHDPWIDQVPMHAISSSFLGSARGETLLKEFRTQLLLVIDDPQENILNAIDTTAEASQVYTELMLRQVNLLRRLFLKLN